MSATNTTTHYNLPSFVGSDKPAWLVDWNGAMAAIDSAIYEAKSTADQAVTAAAAVASDLATLAGTVSTQGSSITTLSETLTTAVGNINTINSLIGNGTPTTTDQTIIGAINEINAEVGDMNTSLSDLNDYIVKNKFGSGVSISGYSSTNLYTTPSDGYAYLRGSDFNDSVALYIIPSDGNTNRQVILQTTGVADGPAHLATFVKKGMKIYAASSSEFTMCLFYPLE